MITSTSNQQIKDLVRFQKKSRFRDEAGVFIVEGPRMASEIPADRIEKLYVSESYAKKNGFSQYLSSHTEILSDAVFAHVSDTKTPQGVLAVVRRAEYGMEDILSKNPMILVLDNLQDPGNVGTIFRTAEAAGISGIILSRDCVDIYNPKVIRSTMGAVFRIPFFCTDDLPGCIGEIRQKGVTVYAAHLQGSNSYDKEDYTGGCAFLIGNEGNGLREEVAECADRRVLIPMLGKAESLNAAVASAVLMFEAARQRRG